MWLARSLPKSHPIQKGALQRDGPIWPPWRLTLLRRDGMMPAEALSSLQLAAFRPCPTPPRPILCRTSIRSCARSHPVHRTFHPPLQMSATGAGMDEGFPCAAAAQSRTGTPMTRSRPPARPCAPASERQADYRDARRNPPGGAQLKAQRAVSTSPGVHVLSWMTRLGSIRNSILFGRLLAPPILTRCRAFRHGLLERPKDGAPRRMARFCRGQFKFRIELQRLAKLIAA